MQKRINVLTAMCFILDLQILSRRVWSDHAMLSTFSNVSTEMRKTMSNASGVYGRLYLLKNTCIHFWFESTHLLLRTGQAPIATVMRRLLTGHAASFNRRHRRYGHLFQNRYKRNRCGPCGCSRRRVAWNNKPRKCGRQGRPASK